MQSPRVDGVDMVAIGANDMTTELGIPGQYDHPEFRAAVATVAEACKRHETLLMLGGVSDEATFASLATLGICPMRLTGMDTDLLYAAAKERVDKLNAAYTAERAESGVDGTWQSRFQNRCRPRRCERQRATPALDSNFPPEVAMRTSTSSSRATRTSTRSSTRSPTAPSTSTSASPNTWASSAWSSFSRATTAPTTG